MGKEDRRARFTRQKKNGNSWQPIYSVGDRVEVKGSIERPGNKTGTIKRIDTNLQLYYVREDGGIVGLPYPEYSIIRKEEKK